MRLLLSWALDARPHLILLAVAVHLAGSLVPDGAPERTAPASEPLTMNVDWFWELNP